MFDSLAVLVTLSRLNSRTVWVGITGRIGATFTSFTTTAKVLVALRHPAVNIRGVRFRPLGQPFILNITQGLGEGLHGRRNSRAFAAAYDGREAGVDRGCKKVGSRILLFPRAAPASASRTGTREAEDNSN